MFEQRMHYRAGIIMETGFVEPVAHGHIGHPQLIGFDVFGIRTFKCSSRAPIGGQKFDDAYFIKRFILTGEGFVIKMRYYPRTGIAFITRTAFGAAEGLRAVSIGIYEIGVVIVNDIFYAHSPLRSIPFCIIEMIAKNTFISMR